MFKHNSSTSNSDTAPKKGWLFFKLALVLAFVILFVAQSMPEYANGYEAAMIDKVARLESIDGPRIVLIGNSNLVFGIKSELIEQAFGIPVVNMGLHGAQGKAFLEQAAKLDVHQGDIYIVCHSELSDADTIPDPMLVWLTVENHPALWRMVRPKDWSVMLQNFPTYLKRCLTLEVSGRGNGNTGGAYTRTAFNTYGDNDYPRGLGTFRFQPGSVPEPVINDICVNRLNELNAYLQQRGASMVVAGYPIGAGEYTPDISVYQAFQQVAEQQLDCPLISTYTDYFLDYKYFYDSYMHLTDAGATLRTAQLIRDLDGYLGENAQVRGQYLYVGEGFYQTDVDDSVNFRTAYQWNWSTTDSTLSLYSFDTTDTTLDVTLQVEAAADGGQLTVVTAEGTDTFDISTTGGTVTFRWTVHPGDNAVTLHSDISVPDPSVPTRNISFRIFWDDTDKITPYVVQEG